ncbi:MAG: hypothetical protein U0230_19895 [Polyangiales bacterium]
MKRHPVVACFALVEAAVVLFVVHGLLPASDARVDAPLTLLAVALIFASLGLFVGAAWARRVAVAVLSLALAAGMGLVTILVAGVGEVSGIYGSIGQGVGLLLVFALLLVVPYLIALPAAQLYYLLRAGASTGPSRAA